MSCKRIGNFISIFIKFNECTMCNAIVMLSQG